MKRRTFLLIVFSLCLVLAAGIAGIGVVTKSSEVPFVSFFFSPIQSLMISIFHTTKPRTDIEKLQAENVVLTKQLAHMSLVEADNKALRDQFQTTSPDPNTLLPATVVGMPGFIPGMTIPDTLIISVGAQDGVTTGQAVVYKDQFIGTIDTVHSHTSKVTLFTDTSTSFAAKTAQTNALGIVKGLGNGQVELDNVVLSDTLKVGDMIVTNPDMEENGKGLPPGLVIGKIISVDKQPSNLFQKAHIQILVDVTRLTDVFVVVSR